MTDTDTNKPWAAGEWSPNDTQLAILARMAQGTGSPIATHWLDEAAGRPGDTAGTRSRLQTLARRGMVEGVDNTRCGRVYWWQITEAGRAALQKARGGEA